MSTILINFPYIKKKCKNLTICVARSDRVARLRSAARSIRLGPKNTWHPPAGRPGETVTRNGLGRRPFLRPAGQGGRGRVAAEAPSNPGVGPPRLPRGIPGQREADGRLCGLLGAPIGSFSASAGLAVARSRLRDRESPARVMGEAVGCGASCDHQGARKNTRAGLRGPSFRASF